ncbi:hypothetical protein MKX03_013796 [Papaver bracteatum]|nr:hypothetical protein MKX03_013796 [Papaver bracteatum]
MGTKNVKVFIWLALTVAVLTASEDLFPNAGQNGVKDPKYGVSLTHCGSKGCCDFGESRSSCAQCCS